MKTCSLHDFTETLKPWLSKDYIRQVYLNEEGNIVFHFMDNVQDTYHINDCTIDQIREILNDLREKGVNVTGP